MTNSDERQSTVSDDLQSFMLRFWREDTARRSIQPVWRGVIVHIASGERYYFHNLDGMLDFLRAYLSGKPVTRQPSRSPDQHNQS